MKTAEEILQALLELNISLGKEYKALWEKLEAGNPVTDAKEMVELKNQISDKMRKQNKVYSTMCILKEAFEIE